MSDQFPVAVSLVMLNHLFFRIGPAAFRITIGNMPDCIPIRLLVLIIAINIHRRFKQLMVMAHLFRHIFLGSQGRDVIIRKMKAMTHRIGDPAAFDKNLKIGPNSLIGKLRKWNGADPAYIHLSGGKPLQGGAQQLGIPGQADAENDDSLISGDFVQKFGQPPGAHAQDVGLFAMPQCQRGGTGIIIPEPTG
ncbi:hypothetical protein SDC9_137157 [bioreactor metagenome]|uniref:Uncharacterized protein n=1 Tax=bioreactor metagenome TaxID=1076179 RepID=A0A645DLB4_9ZZZZ